jgi:hypothetical protein
VHPLRRATSGKLRTSKLAIIDAAVHAETMRKLHHETNALYTTADQSRREQLMATLRGDSSCFGLDLARCWVFLQQAKEAH